MNSGAVIPSEAERLPKPVAWRYRTPYADADHWHYTTEINWEYAKEAGILDYQPLYLAAPISTLEITDEAVEAACAALRSMPDGSAIPARKAMYAALEAALSLKTGGEKSDG
jgi:hypothetical protein